MIGRLVLALSALCLSYSSFAAAENGAVPFVPGAQMLFDCHDGPGYLRFTIINEWGQQQSRTPFLGPDCRQQIELLKRTRKRIEQPAVIAVCSPVPAYLSRWMAYPNGDLVPLPMRYFERREECLNEARELNGF